MAVIKAGTYKFNEEVHKPPSTSYKQECEFVFFDGRVRKRCDAFKIGEDGNSAILVYYRIYNADYYRVYISGINWLDNDYRIVLFETDQEVSEEFYDWFLESTTPTIATILCGDDTILLKAREIATLHTNGKLLNNDLVIEVSAVEQTPVMSGGSDPVLISKTITENGTYNVSADGADGYDSVTVAVFASIYNGEYLNL